MALSSALLSGVTGLTISQTMLDVVGNNLANSQTSGFKSQRVSFQDLLYQTQKAGSGPSPAVGGVNPSQIGFGALVGSVDSNFRAGALTTTGRSLDLAVSGVGFFVVNNGKQNYFTRNGTFDLDQQGYVVDAATGFRLQRAGSLGEATATTPAFQTPGNRGIRIPLGIGIPGSATANVSLRGNLTASAAVNDTYTTAIQTFDSQGTQRSLTLTFTKTAPNTWSLNASVSGGTVTGVPITGITFNANGTLAGPASATINLAFPPDLPTAQPVNINFGTVGQADGLSQFGGDSTAVAVRQDGFSSGTLITFNVDAGGIFQGIFSNGEIRPLAQLALASFANEGGLIREGQNLFSQGNNSGPPDIDAPQTGGRGSIQAGALEGSNVDVSNEFTRLILAQRSFQINARAVSAASDVLQELANIVR
jgi:flagellar hook protein FlgE